MLAVKAFYKNEKGVLCTGGIGNSKHTEWKVGDEVKVDKPISLCNNGIHFFRKEDLCFGIDFFNFNNRKTVFCEIEVLGDVISDTFKKCTNHIKVIKYIPEKEWKKTIDEKNNSGYGNSGNRNSGNRNSGDCNSGNGYINFFCTETKYFLFDKPVKCIPHSISNLNMLWFDLEGKTYKEAWAKCPKSVIENLKKIPEIMKNKKKFKEITGVSL